MWVAPQIDKIGAKMDWGSLDKGDVWVALITFLYVDLFDTTGTLFAMATMAGFVNEDGDFEGQSVAFVVDGLATTLGALMGTSPVTTYIESGVGIEEGGRTGLTSITTGLCFLLCIFFAPIFSSVPPWATGPALIVVGALMIKALARINWDNFGDALPAFLTVIIMPLTYSIAYGIIAGIGSYILINGTDFLINLALGKASWPPPYVDQLQRSISTRKKDRVAEQTLEEK